MGMIFTEVRDVCMEGVYIWATAVSILGGTLYPDF